MKEANLTGVTYDADAENGNTEPPTSTNTIVDNVPEEIVDNVPEEIVDNVPEETVDNAVEDISNEPDPPKRNYQYLDGQWAPHNPQGERRYEPEFLLQLQNDPLAQKKPENLPSAVIKFDRPDGNFSLSSIARPTNSESFLPGFAKSTMSPKRGPNQRDMNRGKSTSMVAKPMMMRGSGMGAPPGQAPPKIMRVSLSLRDDVKLNQSENAWKPTIKKPEAPVEDEETETKELYRAFRGILNKLTPQKFERLVQQVKVLNINSKERLEGVIDLVFEKAIEEPAFSETYAGLCMFMSQPDNLQHAQQSAQFRVALIKRCQKQFETTEIDDAIVKLEKDMVDSRDATKKKELQLMLAEENRKVRMRHVGNIRFIGELYKRKMLTPKIMVYCMNYLVEKHEEEKLECLCKLLTTIGQQVESEAKESVAVVFKRMLDIVEQSKRGTIKISSRIRFMIQDTILLKNMRWTKKGGVDAGPKTMDQIKKEDEEKQREIEIMNSGPMSGDRRGGRDSRDGRDVRRGDSRRGGSNNFSDWPQTKVNTKFTVDTSKIKAGVNTSNKNISNVKLGPPANMWNFGSGAKPQQAKPAAPAPITNMFSMLNTDMDPVPPPMSSYQPKGASMEKAPLGNEYSGSRSASMEGAKTAVLKPIESAETNEHEPLDEKAINLVRSIINESLVTPGDEEMANEFGRQFKNKPQQHSAVFNEIFNLLVEKPVATHAQLSKSLIYLVQSKIFTTKSFVSGLSEFLEFASDIVIDCPKLYENLAFFLPPHIVTKHITLQELFVASEKVISDKQGDQFLRALMKELEVQAGPSFAKSVWKESGLTFENWMDEEKSNRFKKDFAFLEGETQPTPSITKKLTPLEVQQELLQLMRAEHSTSIIKGWVHDNIGKESDEDWFMRSLTQAICEYAISGAGEKVPRLDENRMGKYISMINEFGTEEREINCLIGIQQLLVRREHPRGVALDIFQYLSNNDVITTDAFLKFEKSELEPEGKAVLIKSLQSFYVQLKEGDDDDEDSGSED